MPCRYAERTACRICESTDLYQFLDLGSVPPANAFVAALEAPREKVDKEIFNVGDNDLNYPIKEVGRIVEEHTQDAEVRFVEHKEDDRTYRVNFDKINHIIGWETTRTIGDGVEEIREWILENDVTDYTDEQYRNSDYPYM